MSLVLMLVVLKNEEALEAKTIRKAERGASADDSLVRLCILHVSSSFQGASADAAQEIGLLLQVTQGAGKTIARA